MVILPVSVSVRMSLPQAWMFGLDSFAEGVDLKGDNLTHVIIVKLRFSVPNSPIDKTLAQKYKYFCGVMF
jgi:ATP-dependent DNA helicase DinG